MERVNNDVFHILELSGKLLSTSDNYGILNFTSDNLNKAVYVRPTPIYLIDICFVNV
tara:strand:+ start:306 stop:476 length:171 start_codon:yes stop_codon:yes gene_type:complete